MVTRAAYPGAMGGALREYREGRQHDPRWTRANWGHHAYLIQAFESIAMTLVGSGFDLRAGDSIAGVGPSGARFVEYVARSGEVGPGVVAVSLGDDGTLPLPDDSVQAVVLSFVLSEMPSPLARAQVARECRRVLSPDGRRGVLGRAPAEPAKSARRRDRTPGARRLFPDSRIEAQVADADPAGRAKSRCSDAVPVLTARIDPIAAVAPAGDDSDDGCHTGPAGGRRRMTRR